MILGSNGPITVSASCSSNPGVNIRILKNGSQIWPSSGWQSLGHGSSYTFSGVLISINTGDQIQFVVAPTGSDSYCDTTTWDQTVSYSTASWTKCADEGGTCTFSGTTTVRYGANGQYYIKSATGSIGCNNSVFGDPLVGIVKACYYQ